MNLAEHSGIEAISHDGQELEVLLAELPALPENWVRLTHFTLEHVAQLIIKGKDFDYTSQGMISSTTDSFSSNSLEEFRILLETKQVGALSRAKFGDCVVLIDLDGREHKSRDGFYYEHSQVPNSNIVGYIKIIDHNGKREYKFFRNPKYAPVITELQRLPSPLSRQRAFSAESTKTEVTNDSKPEDIW